MGKMKELFMRQNYPNGDYDLEREYLINDSIAKEWEYEEFLKLQNSPEINIINSKIEVENGGKTTRIQVNPETQETDKQFEGTELRF